MTREGLPEAPVVLLRVADLRKAYASNPVLAGVDLTVREGEIYGFLGRNGAGKSTTIRTLMGIQTADSGTLELFGQVVARPTLEHKRAIGYVSQEQNFYTWMTCEGLGRFVAGFFPSWDGAEFVRLLAAFDVPLRRKVGELSGGMKVKLALALALAHRPRLLILDEPTSGLDPAARREFLEIVSVQAREAARATFFSSHIVEEVERVADRVGIIDGGRLVYEGPIEDLRDRVRRAVLPAEWAAEHLGEPPRAPEGFELLERVVRGITHELVLRAEPSRWADHPFPPHSVRRMTLEDVFLAIAAGRTSHG